MFSTEDFQMRIAVADIGGTAVKCGIFENGKLSQVHEFPTDALQGGKAVINSVINALAQLPDFQAVGISTAGQVNEKTGCIIYANDNLPDYTGMNLKEIFENRFHVPAAILNDVNAAALGEAFSGAGEGLNDFLMLTYGTGVGGAIVIDGKLFTGKSWSAGEFGGIVVHPEKMIRGSGFSGCYENYASATALVRQAQDYYPEITDGRMIFENIRIPSIKGILDKWIFEVVIGLVTLSHIFNPSAIILGGGIMSQQYVIDQIRLTLRPYLAGGFQDTAILQAGLGNRAGMTGAAAAALERIKGKLSPCI